MLHLFGRYTIIISSFLFMLLHDVTDSTKCILVVKRKQKLTYAQSEDVCAKKYNGTLWRTKLSSTWSPVHGINVTGKLWINGASKKCHKKGNRKCNTLRCRKKGNDGIKCRCRNAARNKRQSKTKKLGMFVCQRCIYLPIKACKILSLTSPPIHVSTYTWTSELRHASTSPIHFTETETSASATETSSHRYSNVVSNHRQDDGSVSSTNSLPENNYTSTYETTYPNNITDIMTTISLGGITSMNISSTKELHREVPIPRESKSHSSAKNQQWLKGPYLNLVIGVATALINLLIILAFLKLKSHKNVKKRIQPTSTSSSFSFRSGYDESTNQSARKQSQDTNHLPRRAPVNEYQFYNPALTQDDENPYELAKRLRLSYTPSRISEMSSTSRYQYDNDDNQRGIFQTSNENCNSGCGHEIGDGTNRCNCSNSCSTNPYYKLENIPQPRPLKRGDFVKSLSDSHISRDELSDIPFHIAFDTIAIRNTLCRQREMVNCMSKPYETYADALARSTVADERWNVLFPFYLSWESDSDQYFVELESASVGGHGRP